MAIAKTTTRVRWIRWVLGGTALIALIALVPARPEASAPIGCGAVLTGDHTYALTQDVGPCSGPGPAITVVGPATLKLNGWTVSCEHTIELEPDLEEPDRPFPHTVPSTPGSVGILLTGTGADLLGAGTKSYGANEDAENRVLGCDKNVVVAGDGKHEVEGVHSVQSLTAAFLVESDWNELTGNVVRQQLVDYTPMLTDDPRPARCEQNGYVIEGDHNELYRNVGADCLENGFQIDGVENRVEDNIARDNDGYGFGVNGTENRIHGNVAVKNITGGFLVDEEGENNTLGHNIASQSGDDDEADGFEILGNSNTLKSNTADNNGRYGISVSGNGNTITENAVSRSVEKDMFDANGSCISNSWYRNIFGTKDPSCIK